MKLKATDEAKEEMKGKLSSIKEDVKKAQIKKSIDNVKLTDGKVTADFYVEGLPSKKFKSGKGSMEVSSYDETHRRYPKIFDTVKDFTKYAEEFFEENFEGYE